MNEKKIDAAIRWAMWLQVMHAEVNPKHGTTEEISTIIDALNRQKPMPAKIDKHNTGLCPRCGEDIMLRWVTYCPICGQRVNTYTEDSNEQAD